MGPSSASLIRSDVKKVRLAWADEAEKAFTSPQAVRMARTPKIFMVKREVVWYGGTDNHRINGRMYPDPLWPFDVVDV